MSKLKTILEKKLPLATEYRILLDLLIMGAESDVAFVKKELKKLDKREAKERAK